mgnify:CR=1 FL=1
MVRTQVQFTEEQHRRLKALARRRGVSLSELVRRSVDVTLEAEAAEGDEIEARYRGALAIAGQFRDVDGATDVAVHHDRYLDSEGSEEDA